MTLIYAKPAPIGRIQQNGRNSQVFGVISKALSFTSGHIPFANKLITQRRIEGNGSYFLRNSWLGSIAGLGLGLRPYLCDCVQVLWDSATGCVTRTTHQITGRNRQENFQFPFFRFQNVKAIRRSLGRNRYQSQIWTVEVLQMYWHTTKRRLLVARYLKKLGMASEMAVFHKNNTCVSDVSPHWQQISYQKTRS